MREKEKYPRPVEFVLDCINPERQAKHRIENTKKLSESVVDYLKTVPPEHRMESCQEYLSLGVLQAIYAFQTGQSENTAMEIFNQYSKPIFEFLKSPEE